MLKPIRSIRVRAVACVMALAMLPAATRAKAADYLPLYRFYNTKIHQHEYTNSAAEVEKWRKDKDKKDEGILGWLPAKGGKDITRLYRARSTVHGRHYYYAVKPRGLKNIEIERAVMYVYKRKATGRVAIHGTCLAGGEDMLFTKSREEVDNVFKDTKNAIGQKRRKFINAFYVLEEDPEKKDADSKEKKGSQ